jgi:hypothetical protein
MGGEEDAQMIIVWGNVVKFGILHIIGLNGLVLLPGAHAKTMMFAFLMWLVACVVSLLPKIGFQHFEKCGLSKTKFLTKLIKGVLTTETEKTQQFLYEQLFLSWIVMTVA